jgi:hypothetical protein
MEELKRSATAMPSLVFLVLLIAKALLFLVTETPQRPQSKCSIIKTFPCKLFVVMVKINKKNQKKKKEPGCTFSQMGNVYLVVHNTSKP